MELLNWLTDSLTAPVVRADIEEPKILAVGFCPFTGCHWLVEDTALTVGPEQMDRQVLQAVRSA